MLCNVVLTRLMVIKVNANSMTPMTVDATVPEAEIALNKMNNATRNTGIAITGDSETDTDVADEVLAPIALQQRQTAGDGVNGTNTLLNQYRQRHRAWRAPSRRR